MRRALPCTLSLLAALLPAQINPGDAVVATRLTGTPATQLLAVDLVTGSVRPLPRFAADGLAPLAVTFDQINRDLLLAVDLGNGNSRVLRFVVQNGLLPASQRTMGDVPGRIVQIALADNDIVAAVGGSQGSVYRLPRNGGSASLLFARAHLGAMQSYGPAYTTLALGWSASSGPPANDAGVGIVDLTTGQFVLGPETFAGYPHPVITGVMDLPTALPRQILTHADGTVAVHVMLMGMLPTPLAIQPPVPAGGATALHPTQAYGFTPLVLGGVAFPHLWTFDPFAANPVRSQRAGPLPGDPVDFAIAPTWDTALLFFGDACGGTMAIGATGMPSIGSGNFSIGLTQANPSAPTLFVLGLSDQLGGVLPLPLPSGCPLLVSPDATAFHLTSAQGTATQPLPVPNQWALAGLILFGQWLQAPGLPFATSAAVTIHVGP